ncbi:MAG: hypothetical protein KAT74_06640 [Candidatus Cloacimonetes bacterium]|nr:hypothetical protein [Candidatus Cloacimonadota bacterium]
MKKIALILLLFLTSTFLFAGNISFFSRIDFKNYYDSNILKLSSVTLSEFEDSTNPDKFKIETSDDFVTSAKIDFGLKYHFLGHTQIDKIVLKYNKYWKNNVKDNGYLRIGIKQFFSKEINLSLNYYLYPEIYSNRYKSVLDDDYHDYTYSKNVYNINFNWKFYSDWVLDYKFEFSQLYYNKYFTEYDAGNFASSISLGTNISGFFNLIFKYSYKVSNADAEDAFDNPETISQIKDASYESNIYNISFSFPELIVISDKKIGFYSDFSLEKRFYQSEEPGDDYHLGRDDCIMKFLSHFTYPFSEDFRLRIFYEYETRNTDSPFNYVEDDKEYSLYKSGVSLIVSF